MALYECVYRVNEAILKGRISWKKKSNIIGEGDCSMVGSFSEVK